MQPSESALYSTTQTHHARLETIYGNSCNEPEGSVFNDSLSADPTPRAFVRRRTDSTNSNDTHDNQAKQPTSSTRFSAIANIWSKQRMIWSSSSRPGSRPVSAPPLDDREFETLVDGTIASGSSSTSPLDLASTSPVFALFTLGSRPQSRLSRSSLFAKPLSAPAATSSPTPSQPHSPSYRNAVLGGFSEANSDTASTSTSASTKTINPEVVAVQQRIVEGRAQLEHYTQLIQNHERERSESQSLILNARLQRDTLAGEIEAMESLLATSKNQEQADSNPTGYFWSISPPKHTLTGVLTDTPSQGPACCCLYGASATEKMTSPMSPKSPQSFHNSQSITSPQIVSPLRSAKAALVLLSNPRLSRPSSFAVTAGSSSQAQMCPCCLQRAILAEKQATLRRLQQTVEQLLQKINLATSKIRHLQRTFIQPIEDCLAKDRDEWTRLSSARK
ncbi:hypothetical protein BGZ51_007568 [Haplosporangium sp. Z 767]|nr:hypothetical protein BGZ51_007568 [Haplosporangium sp. Z 767]KAF9191715.1 hypothetical protein BGZ50_009188 [Haplosporangium sp. Z 11]